MPNAKLNAQITKVLGLVPQDSAFLLPRDGSAWMAQRMDAGKRSKPSIGSLVADALLPTEARPGGHVLGMPFPPEGPVMWALTEHGLVIVDTEKSLLSWRPGRVFATFDPVMLAGVWHEKADRSTFAVHLQMRDGNHWEFTVTKKDHGWYQGIDAELMRRIGSAG